jgi:hypothetical protein
MALGSTQPLTEMSTRCISQGKGDRCVRLTTLPPSCAVVMKSGILNFLASSGPFQACKGTALPLILYSLYNFYASKWDTQYISRRSQWLRGLRRGSAIARSLGLRVRIPPCVWISMSCECCVFWGRGLWDGTIPRSEESYRLWCI